MKQLSAHEKMLGHLQDPSVQSRLRQRLQEVQPQITTDITRAGEITNTTAAQLRHWEAQGLLTPERTSANGRHGDRRYSYYDIVTLLIINELLNHTPVLVTVAQFLKDENRFIEKFVEEVIRGEEGNNKLPRNILQSVSQAEESLFWRIFVPRAMYLSMYLLFKQTVSGDTGLVLPVPDSYAYAQQVRIQSIENLPDLGEVLLGWHSRAHLFCTFLESKVVLEPSRWHQLVSLDWPLENNAAPKSTYLIVEGRLENLLEKASDDARKVAGRVLKLLQETTPKWKPYLQSGGDFMTYHSPHFKDPKLGDRFLNEMAEIVIQLGGMQKAQQKPRWRFCCILLPNDYLVPLREQSLVVQAQSRKSPHQINETSLPPSDQKSISIKAFQSGQIVYRPSSVEEEPSITWLEVEGAIGSAIAVPIEKTGGQPVGVMYIASDEQDAFSADDQVLLRMIERIIAEQVLTYPARSLLVENLSEVITNPQKVDRFFSEFRIENQFISELDNLLEQVKLKTEGKTQATELCIDAEKRPFQYLSFIAIDIDNLSVDTRKYGDRMMRNLVLAVGQRIQEWISQNQLTLDGIQLYRMYADRFYLLLKDIPIGQAIKYAGQLQKTLQEPPYRIEASHVSPDRISLGSRLIFKISVRLGVTGYTYEGLREILDKSQNVAKVRVRFIRALAEALSLGKDAGGNNITAWDLNTESFKILSSDEALNSQGNAFPLQTYLMKEEIQEDLIRRISDDVLDKLRRELKASLSHIDKGED